MPAAYPAIAAVAAVLGAGAGVYSATRSAPKPPPMGQQQKEPDVLNRNPSPNAGQIATMLSGAQGVNPGSLSLGRNTLLGQ